MAETDEFTIWLKRRLAARRMSQRQLAQRSGVDHSTISRLLNGERTPSRETERKLATVLDRGSDRKLAAVLRKDPGLADEDVTDILTFYLAVRAARAERDQGLDGTPNPGRYAIRRVREDPAGHGQPPARFSGGRSARWTGMNR
jgi:transcriptional regulator with XRE-family HTH domain